MPCSWCPADGDESKCSVCRDWSALDREHRDSQRRYSRTVAAVCLAGLVAFVLVAAACAVWNQLGGK